MRAVDLFAGAGGFSTGARPDQRNSRGSVMFTETITWYEVGEKLPDAWHPTLALAELDSIKSIRLAWRGRHGWFDVETGDQVTVTRWAEMPTGEPG